MKLEWRLSREQQTGQLTEKTRQMSLLEARMVALAHKYQQEIANLKAQLKRVNDPLSTSVAQVMRADNAALQDTVELLRRDNAALLQAASELTAADDATSSAPRCAHTLGVGVANDQASLLLLPQASSDSCALSTQGLVVGRSACWLSVGTEALGVGGDEETNRSRRDMHLGARGDPPPWVG